MARNRKAITTVDPDFGMDRVMLTFCSERMKRIMVNESFIAKLEDRLRSYPIESMTMSEAAAMFTLMSSAVNDNIETLRKLMANEFYTRLMASETFVALLNMEPRRHSALSNMLQSMRDGGYVVVLNKNEMLMEAEVVEFSTVIGKQGVGAIVATEDLEWEEGSNPLLDEDDADTVVIGEGGLPVMVENRELVL